MNNTVEVPQPEIGIGTRIYRFGSSEPYTIVGERSTLSFYGSTLIRPQWELRYDDQYSHTSSIYARKQNILISGDWTLDEAEWQASEVERKSIPVEPRQQPATIKTADLIEQRHVNELKLATLMKGKLIEIAGDTADDLTAAVNARDLLELINNDKGCTANS